MRRYQVLFFEKMVSATAVALGRLTSQGAGKLKKKKLAFLKTLQAMKRAHKKNLEKDALRSESKWQKAGQ